MPPAYLGLTAQIEPILTAIIRIRNVLSDKTKVTHNFWLLTVGWVFRVSILHQPLHPQRLTTPTQKQLTVTRSMRKQGEVTPEKLVICIAGETLRMDFTEWSLALLRNRRRVGLFDGVDCL